LTITWLNWPGSVQTWPKVGLTDDSSRIVLAEQAPEHRAELTQGVAQVERDRLHDLAAAEGE
jgi:hypothetical protein